MTPSQELAYSKYRELEYEYDYTDKNGTVHMTRFYYIGNNRYVDYRIEIDCEGNVKEK